MRNFILIHLESVSKLILKMNSELFPNLNKIMHESIYYSNYYSSATSTLMVMSDLCYGGMYREKCTKLENEFNDMGDHISLFDELKEEGYSCKGIIWPKLTTYSKLVNGHILGKELEVEAPRNYEDFIHSIDKNIAESHTFALFVGNYASHVSYRNVQEIKGSNSLSRCKEGYKLVDDTCEKIFESLTKHGKKEETVVILYGDHGDDYWGHRLHNGYTHAIEPYSNIIHTPLIVWNSMAGKGVSDELLSTLDIRDKVLNMLHNKPQKVDRQYIFSRNIYANQKNKVLSLGKGYAVVSDDYILMVSIRGLELYNVVLDPTNACNLLEFFDMNGNGDIRFCQKFKKGKSAHFLDFFTNGEVRHLKDIYRQQRKYLLYETEKLYKVAGKSVKDRNRELNFKAINRTHLFNIYDKSLINVLVKCFWNRKQMGV